MVLIGQKAWEKETLENPILEGLLWEEDETLEKQLLETEPEEKQAL